MAIRELTCISCPLGCPLKVETDENGAVLQVTGNTCKRGEIYGKKEVTAPERTVTSTVAVVGGSAPLVSVRTRTDIPKGKIFDCMEAIRAAKIQAPVSIGDVVVENVCGTGVDVVATKAVAEKPAAGAAECLRSRAGLLPSAGGCVTARDKPPFRLWQGRARDPAAQVVKDEKSAAGRGLWNTPQLEKRRNGLWDG